MSNHSIANLPQKKGFDNIRAPKKALTAMWTVEAGINNGGFGQLSFNSVGDIAFYASEPRLNKFDYRLTEYPDKVQELLALYVKEHFLT